MKNLAFSLLALTALTAFAIPARAGDTANIQDATQITTQDGSGNTSFQRSAQEVRMYKQGGGQGTPSNVGNVQSIYQDTFQQGENNYSQMENRQNINIRKQGRGNQSNMNINQGN
jgi:hypothetical protein